jgi:hypothetical protein
MSNPAGRVLPTPPTHRQLKLALRGDRSIHRRPRRRERGTYAVTGVFEQPTAVPLDRRAQHLVMRGQRRPHPLPIGLPPTGRTLHIGEHKRHHTRRSSRRGHPRRMPHQTAEHAGGSCTSTPTTRRSSVWNRRSFCPACGATIGAAALHPVARSGVTASAYRLRSCCSGVS